MAQDPIWAAIRSEAQQEAEREPLLASFLFETILNHHSLEEALCGHLAHKLADHTLHALALNELMLGVCRADPGIGISIRADLKATVDRDPACQKFSTPLLFFKGFQALQSYRIAHHLWRHERRMLASYLQSRVSEVFGVDINPAARIGHGILFDHATGLVIGETAVIENNVTILHEVTLGGTGKHTGDRHPKIREGVLIGAGAKLIGNIEIGAGAKIGTGSVVLHSIPAHRTAVGVPAKVVGNVATASPALNLDHMIPGSKDGDYAI
jgi:serine O-acetyltransferase